MAILEYSSSNGLSSFNLLFECRNVQIREIADENNNHFSYVVDLPYEITSCDERGFEQIILPNKYGENQEFCITTFQG